LAVEERQVHAGDSVLLCLGSTVFAEARDLDDHLQTFPESLNCDFDIAPCVMCVDAKSWPERNRTIPNRTDRFQTFSMSS
jgi:hypothetical protein